MLLFHKFLKKFIMLYYVIEEQKWRRRPRLWKRLLNVYTMSKSSARWVSRLQNTDQKCEKAETSSDNLKFFNLNLVDFCVTLLCTSQNGNGNFSRGGILTVFPKADQDVWSRHFGIRIFSIILQGPNYRTGQIMLPF